MTDMIDLDIRQYVRDYFSEIEPVSKSAHDVIMMAHQMLAGNTTALYEKKQHKKDLLDGKWASKQKAANYPEGKVLKYYLSVLRTWIPSVTSHRYAYARILKEDEVHEELRYSFTEKRGYKRVEKGRWTVIDEPKSTIKMYPASEEKFVMWTHLHSVLGDGYNFDSGKITIKDSQVVQERIDHLIDSIQMAAKLEVTHKAGLTTPFSDY